MKLVALALHVFLSQHLLPLGATSLTFSKHGQMRDEQGQLQASSAPARHLWLLRPRLVFCLIQACDTAFVVTSIAACVPHYIVCEFLLPRYFAHLPFAPLLATSLFCSLLLILCVLRIYSFFVHLSISSMHTFRS